MSTNASIAVQHADGSYDQIYLHWDGDKAGKTLRTHYTTQEKVEQLIALGDLSSLGPAIGEKHDFGVYDPAVCTAYGRDRGEKNTEAQHFRNFDELQREGDEQQYNYLFIDGEWYVCNHSISFDKLLPIGGIKEVRV